MKIYLVRRTDFRFYDWDTFDSFVVRAENEERALELCNKEDFDGNAFRKENTEIEEVKEEGIEEVILGSFHAG